MNRGAKAIKVTQARQAAPAQKVKKAIPALRDRKVLPVTMVIPPSRVLTTSMVQKVTRATKVIRAIRATRVTRVRKESRGLREILARLALTDKVHTPPLKLADTRTPKPISPPTLRQCRGWRPRLRRCKEATI